LCDCERGFYAIGANLGDQTRKKGGEKREGKPFHGTVQKKLEERYQEKRYAKALAFYDERGPFAREWRPG
jgi:hypothetical protein